MLDKVIYVPDQELYPGEVFESYVEMKESCPLLEEMLVICDKNNVKYVPYKVKYIKCALPEDVSE